jgi:hypothetical protein
MKKLCLLLLTIPFLIGCSDDFLNNATTTGNTMMTIHIDLLNYLDSSQSSIDYGQGPVVTSETGSLILQTPTQSIDVSGDMENISSIELVEMDIDLNFHNETGNMVMHYNAYLARTDEDHEDPLDTPPIISETVSLNGPETVTSQITVESDDRLLALFNSGVMQYTAVIVFDIAEGSDNISGVAVVDKFDITVVATL